MCGICGYIINNHKKPDLAQMIKVMSHRGPDGQGTYTEQYGGINIGLGHCRLAIIDLSDAGHQPMPNRQKTLWITFNGEIYNFSDLKKELIADGYVFNSQTDTEVILYSYQKWGIKCLEKFNGMFAFALWDDVKKQLFLARDRMGIKPLYYATSKSSIAFASEIKAILKSGLVDSEIDINVLPYYLSYLRVAGPHTLFKNIFTLLPGHYLLWQNNGITIKQYWDLPAPHNTVQNSTHRQLEQQTINHLNNAVNLRLISDVPIGAFLSGGIDSSTIIALMAKKTYHPIKTYTIGMYDDDQKQEQYSSDIHYARIFKKEFDNKIDYKEIFLKPNITDLLPKTLWHLESPIADPAAITTYLICKSAKENGTTVLLSGMGGDEIFAGYRRHQLMLMLTLLQKYKLHSVPKFLQKINSSIPLSQHNPLNAYVRFFKRTAKYFHSPIDKTYAGISGWLSQAEINALLRKEVQGEVATRNPNHIHFFNKYRDTDIVWKMLYTDIKTFLVDLNLTYTDKMSMAVSTEVRVPFLDYKLVEWAMTIPSSEKINIVKTKKILKNSMKNILPKKIIQRSKTGFGAPLRSWMLQNDLNEMMHALLSKRQIEKRGLFNVDKIQQMIDKNKIGKEDYSYPLWALMTLELWFQTFIDKKI